MRLGVRAGFVVLFAVLLAGGASAGFDSYVIREGAGGAPAINDLGGGLLEFVINEGGMKAGLGSDDINGFSIGQILNLSITRHDDITRFSAGSGPYVAPYFNIWVTDGLGNYAVIANEPSNPAFQPLLEDNGNGTWSYNLGYDDLADKVVKVYETPGWNSSSSWIHNQFGTNLTFATLATLEIAPPPVSYITNPANGVGGGAPDVLGTNQAYGFNWVFGDTLSNYESGDAGYIVSGASSTAVPEPTTMVMLGMMGAGMAATRLRKRNKK